MGQSCKNCSVGTIPSEDRISCENGLPNQFIQDSTICLDCPGGEIPTEDRLTCVSCGPDAISDSDVCVVCSTDGEVPDDDRLVCIPCPLSQIEVDGKCQDCPIGEAPNEDRISCFVEITCPDDCTSPDQGDCDLKTGTCNCKNGFTCDNCGGE